MRTKRRDGRTKDDMRNVLQDGERMHVPMSMMDARTVDPVKRIYDATGIDIRYQTPGFRFSDEAGRTEKQKAYDEMVLGLSDAWRDADPNTGAGINPAGPIGIVEGDICTCRGSEFPASFGAPGTWQNRNGSFICVPNDDDDDFDDFGDSASRPTATDRNSLYDKAAALAEYEQWLTSEWQKS
jgi:hypothetical protein